MSQLSFSSFDSSLMVRDAQGHYQLATADQIIEAARQAVDQKLQRGASFSSPNVVKAYLCAKLAGYDHEVFAVLFLDSQHRLIEYAEMFHGTIDSTAVYPREVLKEALRLNAAAIIMSHNHPSGTPEPSAADRAFTKQLKEALALVSMTHVAALRFSVNPLFRTNRPRAVARLTLRGLLFAALMLLIVGTAQAAGSSMPWEGPLQSILESIQGPVARIVAVIIIIATGLALAFGDTSGGFRKLIQIVFGLSIAFAASSFFLSFFSFSGGAVV